MVSEKSGSSAFTAWDVFAEHAEPPGGYAESAMSCAAPWGGVKTVRLVCGIVGVAPGYATIEGLSASLGKRPAVLQARHQVRVGNERSPKDSQVGGARIQCLPGGFSIESTGHDQGARSTFNHNRKTKRLTSGLLVRR